jgi:hypothetical protein
MPSRKQVSAKVEQLCVDVGSVDFTTAFPGIPTLFQNPFSHLS